MPPGGDGVYHFSTYVLVFYGKFGRFDIRLNDVAICSTEPDHRDNGPSDFAPGSCSAIVNVVAGKLTVLFTKPKMLLAGIPFLPPRPFLPPASIHSLIDIFQGNIGTV